MLLNEKCGALTFENDGKKYSLPNIFGKTTENQVLIRLSLFKRIEFNLIDDNKELVHLPREDFPKFQSSSNVCAVVLRVFLRLCRTRDQIFNLKMTVTNVLLKKPLLDCKISFVKDINWNSIVLDSTSAVKEDDETSKTWKKYF